METERLFSGSNLLRQTDNVSRLNNRGRDFRLGSFDAAPADRAAVDGLLDRAEQDHVHHLPVIKTLDEDGEKQRPVFVFLEGEGDDAGEQVNEHECREKNERANNVVARPQSRHVSDAELREAPEQNREKKQEVYDRRNQRKQNLEQKDIGQSNPAERAVAFAANGVAMFPESLQRAKSPAETLANERFHGVRNFSAADGVFVIKNLPSVTANGEGEVCVFRHGLPGKASATAHGFGAPGADCAGDHRNAIQQIEGALFQILTGDVLEACQRVSQRLRFMTFTLPATAPMCGSAKWRTRRGIASGSTVVSASMVMMTSPEASARA